MSALTGKLAAKRFYFLLKIGFWFPSSASWASPAKRGTRNLDKFGSQGHAAAWQGVRRARTAGDRAPGPGMGTRVTVQQRLLAFCSHWAEGCDPTAHSLAPRVPADAPTMTGGGGVRPQAAGPRGVAGNSCRPPSLRRTPGTESWPERGAALGSFSARCSHRGP